MLQTKGKAKGSFRLQKHGRLYSKGIKEIKTQPSKTAKTFSKL